MNVRPEDRYARRRRVAAAFAGLAVALAAVVALTRVRDESSPRDDPPAAAPVSPSPTPAASASASHAPPPPTPSPIPGYLLVADRGNDRMLLLDSHKRILWTYPKPGAKPSFPFHFDDDAFFAPDWRSIITNQEEQQTLEIVSFPGRRVLWHYGHVDVRGSSPGYLSTPDDAYLLPDGTRTVADISNCRVLFISPAGHVVRQYGTAGVCGHAPPRLIGKPNGDTPIPGGGMLITEIRGSWIDAIGANGKLMWSVRAPVAYPSDAQWLGDGKVLVADYSSPGHVLVMTKRGTVLWRYGPASGPGMLRFPSLALMLPNGLVAVNDDHRDRVVLIDRAADRIVWQYGRTDMPGRAPGLLDTPDGMDFLPFDVAMRIPAIRAVVTRGKA